MAHGVGGSRTYVERIAKQLSGVHTATPVRAVTRHADGVAIRDDADDVRTVDRVVVATHPDQALRLLTDPTPDEHRLLGAFRLPAVGDDPAHRRLGAAARAAGPRVVELPDGRAATPTTAGCSISYDLKRLQRIEDDADYVVTLNDSASIDPSAVLATMTYAHPTYTRGSVAAQRELPMLNHDRTAFAGAWHGWGFHEDGCVAGLRAAESFGAGWRAP